MRRQKAGSRGFTLLEVMITVALLGMFFSIIYGFLNQNLRFLNRHNSEHDSYLQARTAMFRVTNLLCRYEKLEVSGDVVSADGAANLINFHKNTENISGYQYFFYWDDEKNIGQLRNSSGGVVADGIKEFTFSNEGADLKVTVQAVQPDDPTDPGLTLSTRLRGDRSYNP